MNSVPLQVLLYAFVAGASPVALGATLVVLGSRGGRWNALAFAVGVVIGQGVLCAIAYAVGSAAMPVGHHAHETARAPLELALGIALVVLGGRGGRWNALAFAVGVVIGQGVLCAIAYAVGSAAMPVGHHAHETARALLELALGIALVVLGGVVWFRPPDAPAKPDSRT